MSVRLVLRSVLVLLSGMAVVFVAQSASAQNTRRAAVRFTSAGAHDTSFNNVSSNGGPGRLVQSAPGGNGTVFHDVVAFGNQTVYAGQQDKALLVMRLGSNGRPDTSFGTNGVATASFAGIPGGTVTEAGAFGVAVDPLGGVIAAGYIIQNALIKVAVARFTPQGALNTGFSGDGLVVTTVVSGLHSLAQAVKITSGDTITVTGFTASGANVFAIRYTNLGQLDANFGNAVPKDGIARISIPGAATPIANDMAIDSSSRILIGGTVTVSGQNVFAAWRLTSTGAADTAFSGDGFAAFWPNATAKTNGIAADGGKPVLVGEVGAPGSRQVGILRLTTSGSTDSTFDGDGWRLHNISGSSDEFANDVLIGSSSSIVITGSANDGKVFSSRYNSSGSNTFLTSVDVVSGSTEAGQAVTVDTDGRFVVGGVAAAP